MGEGEGSGREIGRDFFRTGFLTGFLVDFLVDFFIVFLAGFLVADALGVGLLVVAAAELSMVTRAIFTVNEEARRKESSEPSARLDEITLFPIGRFVRR